MKEKLVIRGERWPFILDMLWPVVVLAAVLTLVVSLLLPLDLVVMVCSCFLIGLIFFGIIALSRSRAEYSFLPANEYRGVRLEIRMGRMEIEVSDVHAEDFIFGASWIEKLMGVGHIKIWHTAYKLRGIRNMEEAKAWVAANVRSEAAPRNKKGKKSGKSRSGKA